MNSMKHILIRTCFVLLAMVLSVSAFAQKPDIRSVDKASGSMTQVVTLKGNGFDANPANLVVMFGAVKGVIISSTNEVIEVSIPAGTTYDNISVTHTVSGLTGYSGPQFLLAFEGASEDTFDGTQFTTQQDFASEKTLYDLCLCDFNNDGKTDIVSANEGNDNAFSVYINTTASPTSAINFTKNKISLGSKTLFVKCGDLDGDNQPDLVLAESGGEPRLFIFQNTGGTFSSVPTLVLNIAPSSRNNDRVDIADVDVDGKPEIIVGDNGRNVISIMRNQSTIGAINFDPNPVDITVVGATQTGIVQAKDLNGDLLPDIVTANYQGSDVFILENRSTPGNITFPTISKVVSPGNIMNVRIGDLDGDNKPDIALTKLTATSLTFLRNQSTATISFASATASGATVLDRSWGLDFGDLNGDGKTDIVAGSIKYVVDPFDNSVYGILSILINKSTPGNFSFTSILKRTTYINRHVGIGDLNGDGKPDIAFASVDDVNLPKFSSTISILRNKFCMKPKLAPLGPLNICVGALPTKLTATNGGGVTYNWTRNAAPIANSGNTFDIPAATAPGAYQFAVTAVGEAGTCSKTSNAVTVNIGAGTLTGTPVASSSPSTACKGETVTLSVTGTSDPGLSFEWTGPQGFSKTGQSVTVPAIDIDKAGTYYVDIKFGTCVAKQLSTTVGVIDIPAVAISYTGANVICAGDTKTLSVNVSPATYQWLKDGNPIGGETNATFVANASGSYTVAVTPTGCSTITSPAVTLDVKSIPTAAFNFSPVTACQGQEVSFSNQSTSDPQLTYSWKFGDGQTSTEKDPKHIYTSTNSGNPFKIDLAVSFNGACKADALQQQITITPAPTVAITTSTGKFEICPDETLTLQVPATFTSYAWSDGSTTEKTDITAAGSYSVKVTLTGGCVISANKDITPVAPTVSVSATPETIKQGESTQLTASGLKTYTWEPAETLSDITIPNPIATPLLTTVYTVTGKDQNNACTNTATITITVEGSAITNLLKPSNFFSPNNDNQNDVWKVDKIDQFPQCGVVIYDDKGVKVFEAKPYTNNWNGQTTTNRVLPDGVYYYIIRCDGQESEPRSGSITIIR
jgi:gliding motility-associated-like protein